MFIFLFFRLIIAVVIIIIIIIIISNIIIIIIHIIIVGARTYITIFLLGSNMPCTPEAVDVLRKANVLIAPAMAAGAGGVCTLFIFSHPFIIYSFQFL